MDWDELERRGRKEAHAARAEDDFQIWPQDGDVGTFRTGRFLRIAERTSRAGREYEVLVCEDERGERFGLFRSNRVVEAAEQRCALKPGVGIYVEYHGDRRYRTPEGEDRAAKDLSCAIIDVGAPPSDPVPAPGPAPAPSPPPLDDDDDLPF